MKIILLIAIFGTVAQHCSAQCTATACLYGAAAQDPSGLIIKRFDDNTTGALSSQSGLITAGFTALNSTEACNGGVCGTDSNCAENSVDIFICTCQTYFEATRSFADFVCNDIDECANSTLNDCDPNAICTNASPLFSCACDAGFSGNGTYCEDIQECASNPCGSNADCTEPVPDNFTCTCQSGYTDDPYTNCNDINECANGFHNCDGNAACSNTLGSFDCTCNSGYTGNGTSCADIVECLNTTLFSCPNNSTCVNEIGNYTCVCNAGFTGDATICQDLDECSNSTLNTCPNNSTCTNQPNGNLFTCACDAGFTGNQTHCEDIDECANSTLFNCPNNSTCQNEPNGNGHTCVCDTGFTGNNTYCEDLDECSNSTLNTCPNNSTCNNELNGNGFTCACDAGFTGNQTHCEDIDECANSTLFNCPNNSTCQNEPNGNGHTCVCDTGFTGNDTYCEDLDECSNSTLNTCPNNSTCNNELNGNGFTCACDAGFTGNQTHCEDIQECASNPCHVDADCTEPTAGNYTCTCKNGWSGDGYTSCVRARQAICIEFDITCDSLTFVPDLQTTSTVLYQNVTGLLETAIQSFIVTVDGPAVLDNATYSFVNSTDGRGVGASTVQLCINNTNRVENEYLIAVANIAEVTTCGAVASADECALGIAQCDSGTVCADSSFGYCCYQDIVDYRSSIRFNHTFNVSLHGDSTGGEFADVCQEARSKIVELLDAREARGCTQVFNITCEKLQEGSVEAVLMINSINSTYNFTDIKAELAGAIGSPTSFGTILGAGDFDECSDNYELDRNCSAFATCLNFAGSFTCNCNNTYFDNGTTTTGQICISPITVSCNGSLMTVSVLEAYYNDQNVNLSSLHLANESCTRDTHATIVGDSVQFSVEINDCNTTLTTAADNTTIVASNFISNVPSAAAFTGLAITVPFECQLPGSLNISALFQGIVVEAVLPNVAATGGFNLEFSLMDENFNTTYDSTQRFGSNEIIYGQCKVQNNINSVSVKLNRCWGTPTANSADTSELVFLDNGCGTGNAENLNLISNGDGAARFSMQMFFFTHVNEVYVHCTLQVCTPSCQSTCSGRRRRDVDPVEETEEVTLTVKLKLRLDDLLFNNRTFDIIGINNQQPIIPGNESTTQDITLPIVCAILAFVLIVLLALVVVVAVRKRRSSKDAYDMTHVNMHAIGVKPPAY